MKVTNVFFFRNKIIKGNDNDINGNDNDKNLYDSDVSWSEN